MISTCSAFHYFDNTINHCLDAQRSIPHLEIFILFKCHLFFVKFVTADLHKDKWQSEVKGLRKSHASIIYLCNVIFTTLWSQIIFSPSYSLCFQFFFHSISFFLRVLNFHMTRKDYMLWIRNNVYLRPFFVKQMISSNMASKRAWFCLHVIIHSRLQSSVMPWLIDPDYITDIRLYWYNAVWY